MDSIKYLVVHCSDSPNNRDSVNAAEIHRWHKERGWSGIGYHAVILRSGHLEAGRPIYWDGAHVKGYNNDSLGVCLVGTDSFTEAQLDQLEMLLSYWKSLFPKAAVVGHCELDKHKTCPNFDVQEWLKGKICE